ncbi:MAG: hypothetical protein OXG26_00260 [Caldilineaceae bacterium]|nr:hypothetical protein [Caldilineaceae bacterium]
MRFACAAGFFRLFSRFSNFASHSAQCAHFERSVVAPIFPAVIGPANAFTCLYSGISSSIRFDGAVESPSSISPGEVNCETISASLDARPATRVENRDFDEGVIDCPPIIRSLLNSFDSIQVVEYERKVDSTPETLKAGLVVIRDNLRAVIEQVQSA